MSKQACTVFGMPTAKFLGSLLLATVGLKAMPLACAASTGTGLAATTLPSYVSDYAPLIWLYSQDEYRPSDIGQQVAHTIPMVNRTAVDRGPTPPPLDLNNLDSLNSLGNTSVYLTSKEGIDADPQPDWFKGVTPDEQGKTEDAVSCTIIVYDHGNGTVDAFYFYFYAYNEGDVVLDMMFGDHVGDWEHNMIRFSDGVPQALWYSQHSGGQAFTYNATEKQGQRPIGYSGKGTHAVYAIAGDHDHTIPHFNLPEGLVVDHTDQGVLWDPALSAYAYSYDATTQQFTPYDSSYPVNWLYFNGQWGDDQLPGQDEIFGEAKYTAGPNGPKFKSLVREKVCPSDPCVVLPFRTW